MARILKNTTNSNYLWAHVGITVPALGEVELVMSDLLLVLTVDAYNEISTKINSGDIVVNDGTSDLPITDGLRSIQYPSEAELVRFNNTNTSYKKRNVQEVLEEVRGQVVYDPDIVISSTNGVSNLIQSSKTLQILNGTATGYVFVLPDATTLSKGRKFEVANTNPNAVLLKNDSGAILATINKDDVVIATLEDNDTSDGDWILLVISSIASGVQAFNVVSSTTFSTNNILDTFITGMTITPNAGTYGVWFSSDVIISNNNRKAEVVIYKSNSAEENTRRTMQGVGSNFNGNLQSLGIVSINGAQTLDVRVNISAGSLTINQRSFLIIRLGAE